VHPTARLLPRLAHRAANRLVHAGWRWLDRAGEIIPGTAAAEEFGSFGADSCIDFPPAALQNVASIHIGAGTLVGRNATLAAGYGVGDPSLRPRALVIGDECVLGARTTITAHRSIVIEDGVFFGQGVFVTDTSHGYQDLDLPVGKQLGEHHPVRIGAGTWIGHHAVVLPGTRIGAHVVVAAGSVVRGEIEDFAVVAGNPSRVVRRLEPGVGWVGSRDVRPIITQAEMLGLAVAAEALAGDPDLLD
jgi:carbonic anhydrase/acetyltransferase-like protein (isoleucine patch superfamily)